MDKKETTKLISDFLQFNKEDFNVCRKKFPELTSALEMLIKAVDSEYGSGDLEIKQEVVDTSGLLTYDEVLAINKTFKDAFDGVGVDLSDIKVKDIPPRIQDLYFKEQQNQGNNPDADVKLTASKSNGGFMWKRSLLGEAFWQSILDGDFRMYYFEPDYWNRILEANFDVRDKWFLSLGDRQSNFADWKFNNTLGVLYPRALRVFQHIFGVEGNAVLSTPVSNTLVMDAMNAISFGDDIMRDLLEGFYSDTNKRWINKEYWYDDPSKLVQATSLAEQQQNRQAIAPTKASSPKSTKKASSKTSASTTKPYPTRSNLPSPPTWKDKTQDYEKILDASGKWQDWGAFDESSIKSGIAKIVNDSNKYTVGDDGLIYIKNDKGKYEQQDSYDAIGKIRTKEEMMVLIQRSIYDMIDAKDVENDQSLWITYRDDYEIRVDYYNNLKA